MTEKVEEIMVRNVKTASPHETVLKTAEMMNKYEIGCVVVAEKGVPVGIVTERDMLKRVIVKRKDPAATKLCEIMSRPLVAVAPNTTVTCAAQMMIRQNIKKLPVIIGDRLEGMLSLSDLIPLLREHNVTDLPLKDASDRLKRMFDGYIDPDTNLRKKCPMIILGGAPIGCLGSKCMWYDAHGCVRAR